MTCHNNHRADDTGHCDYWCTEDAIEITYATYRIVDEPAHAFDAFCTCDRCVAEGDARWDADHAPTLAAQADDTQPLDTLAYHAEQDRLEPISAFLAADGSPRSDRCAAGTCTCSTPATPLPTLTFVTVDPSDIGPHPYYDRIAVYACPECVFVGTLHAYTAHRCGIYPNPNRPVRTAGPICFHCGGAHRTLDCTTKGN